VEEVRDSDVAQPDGPDESFVSSGDHRRQLILEERIRCGLSHEPEVDDWDLVHAEAAEVVLDAAPELLGLVVDEHASGAVAPCTDLAHDHEIRRVGVKGFTDELVDDGRAVVLGGVDVVHAAVDRCAQQRECCRAVRRRAEHAWSGESHRSEPDGRHSERTESALLAVIRGVFVHEVSVVDEPTHQFLSVPSKSTVR
jgi:hypothetical protein